MKKYVIIICAIAAMTVIGSTVHKVNKKNIEKAYMQGYDDGFTDVFDVVKTTQRRAIDSCETIALPVIEKKDTVVYYLTSKFCDQLDTVIHERFKRGN